VITLGLLSFSWWRDRAWITLPPNNPYVQGLAGRRRGVLVTLVLDASQCRGQEAERLHNISVHFVGTISVTQRSDGKYWYKVALPLKISRMLLPIKDCVRARVFLEPWQTSSRTMSTARSLSKV
jgi:hypothetical protein